MLIFIGMYVCKYRPLCLGDHCHLCDGCCIDFLEEEMRSEGLFEQTVKTTIMIFLFCFFRIRLISLASQKFISDIANDALQYCKMKGTASGSSRSKTKVSVLQNFNICFKCNRRIEYFDVAVCEKRWLLVTDSCQLSVSALIILSLIIYDFQFFSPPSI